MPRSKSCGPKSYDCFNCQRRTRQKDRYPIHKKYKSLLYKPTGRTPCETDSLCNRCRHMFDSILQRKDDKKKSSTSLQQPEEKVLHPSQQAPFSPPSVTLPFPCTTRGHSSCCLCKRPGPKLVVVPVDVRHRIFISHEIVIPAGARCCPNHLQRNIEKISPSAETTTVNRSYISQLIRFLRTEVLKTEKTRLSFDNSSHLIDSDYVDLLGIPKAAYDDLLKYVDSRVKSTPSRTVRTSLAIFLMKLRGGDSNRVLSTLFNISKSGIRRSIKVIRPALIDGNFVKENLGFQHITREEIIHQHTRPLAQTLFGDNTQPQVILVLDGTYIYINKSSNFKFQRQSFSFHKGRQLVKPMVIVSTSGYFLSVLGPYFAKDNDASILTHIMRSNLEDIRNWVEEDDVFIVDRGFRDSLTYLEELGIQVKMPSFMEKGEKQLSTDAANTSRLVTKIRWVVESANARIKQWKYLSCILPSSQIPFIGDYIRIVCSICNRYLKPLASGSVEEDQALGAKMLFLSKQVNQLKEQVEEQHLDRRTVCWREVSEVVDFPQLDEERLRELTCGSYQLRLSASYAQEHIEGGCNIHMHKEEEGLLRIRIQSRHISSKTYQLWIRYKDGDIVAWYCKCRAGARVVGMCAHTASIVWYLGYARHRCNPSRIGVRDWGEFLEDATAVDESEESDSSGDESPFSLLTTSVIHIIRGDTI